MADRWISAQEFDADMRERIRQTENEIVRSVFGEEEREYNDSFLEEQSRVTGWDGDDLSDAELANTNINGHNENNFDRSLAMDEQLQLQAENTQLKQQVDALNQIFEDQHAAPQREAQRQQVRETVRMQLGERYGLHDLEQNPEKLDRFINDVMAAQHQTQALQNQRVNESLERAHQAYGADFDDAFRDITSMAHSPLATEIVRNIMSSENPGAAVMQHHGSQLVQSLGRRAPPFFAGDRVPLERAPRGSARRGGDWDEAAGFGHGDIERDVMKSVWE
jgi:hypothetical protein